MRRINQRRTKNVVTIIPYVCFLVKQECSSQVVRLCRKGSFLWNSVQDNEVVYSKETEWDVTNADPQYHYDAILAALKLAKDTLPKVEKLDQLDPTPQSIQIPAFRPDIIFVRNSISKWFLFSRFQNNGDLWMLRWMPLVEVLQEPSPPWTRQLGATFSPTCLLMSTRRRWWTSSFAWERTVPWITIFSK